MMKVTPRMIFALGCLQTLLLLVSCGRDTGPVGPSLKTPPLINPGILAANYTAVSTNLLLDFQTPGDTAGFAGIFSGGTVTVANTNGQLYLGLSNAQPAGSDFYGTWDKSLTPGVLTNGLSSEAFWIMSIKVRARSEEKIWTPKRLRITLPLPGDLWNDPHNATFVLERTAPSQMTDILIMASDFTVEGATGLREILEGCQKLTIAGVNAEFYPGMNMGFYIDEIKVAAYRLNP